MNPATDQGATEFLANLSVGTIVAAALTLTLLRLLILQASGALTRRPAADTSLARGLAEILESLIIAGVLVFLVIRPFFVQAFFIPSESMENTLLGHEAGQSQTGAFHKETVHDHIFVNKMVYRYSHPQRGDIIVFKAPKEADAEHKYSGTQVENVLIKRLIAVPGDNVEIKTGPDGHDYVWLDGKMQEEFHNDKDGNLLPGNKYSIREPMDEGLEMNFVFGTAAAKGDAKTPGGPVHLGPHQFWVMGDNRNDSNDSRYWGPLDTSRVMGKASLIFWPLSRVRVLH